MTPAQPPHSEPPPDLGPAELEVLKTLWDARRATVRDILTRLHSTGRDLAYTTVQTFLTRLEQKGYVKADRSGSAFIYTPLITRERVTRSRLRSLMDSIYDGAAGPLVLQLMAEQSLSPDEIAALQKRIDELAADPESSSTTTTPRKSPSARPSPPTASHDRTQSRRKR
jgi:predicted transcriptional regulator